MRRHEKKLFLSVVIIASAIVALFAETRIMCIFGWAMVVFTTFILGDADDE